MPKPKKKRQRSQQRRALAELPILQATDEAEARGDATAALDLIHRDLESRPDQNFWRPERLYRLTQLFAFGPSLPAWVTSRWILAQAEQYLDNRIRGRCLRASEIAVETRGGPDTLIGGDEADARAKVMDHDWVFRQVYLYELGVLEHFVSRVAAPDLLSGADRIRDWMRTPMGAFRFVRGTPLELVMERLDTGEEVTALDIGSATLLEVGDCAIGRLVPIHGGAMFESAPLYVPDEVAQRVSEDPAGWLAAVAAGCAATREHRSPALVTTMPEFGMTTDVPHFVRHRLAIEVARAQGERFPATGLTVDLLRSASVALVRAALDDRLPETDWVEKQWPMVGAALLDVGVYLDVVDGLAPGDLDRLLDLAERLAGPAGAVCRVLAHRLEAAA